MMLFTSPEAPHEALLQVRLQADPDSTQVSLSVIDGNGHIFGGLAACVTGGWPGEVIGQAVAQEVRMWQGGDLHRMGRVLPRMLLLL